MNFSVSKTIWLGNGYGVEFIITDRFSIAFNVITEKDRTLISDENVCVGSDSCIRIVHATGSEESLRDFAVRAREEGISFAEETIIDHKESLDLSTVLDEVLKCNAG